jgi:hypothetical protein
MPKIKKHGEGKFYSTIGYSDFPAALDYLKNQEQHHTFAGNRNL